MVPKALVGRFRDERLSHGAPPSLMAQPALAEFMAIGAFAIHIRRMRRIYAARRRALIEALKPGDGRLYRRRCLARGPDAAAAADDRADDEGLVARARRRMASRCQSLSSHYAGRKRKQGLLLSFAGFSEDEIATRGEETDRGSVMTDAATPPPLHWVEAMQPALVGVERPHLASRGNGVARIPVGAHGM